LSERAAGTVTRISEPLKLTVSRRRRDDGWIMAQVAEVPAAVSQGRTREEARANVLDALQLVLAPEQAVPADRSEALEFTLRRLKRRDLERHLREHGCEVVGEGGNHTKWRRVGGPELGTALVRAVCRQLGAPPRAGPR